MAKRRTEAELRTAKDSARRAVIHQQRVLGVPVLGGRAVDEFVAPIVDKMARETLREEAPARAPRERSDEVQSEYVGTYDWNLRDDTWKAVDPASHIPNNVDRMHRIIQQLMKLPEWKAELMQARRVCDVHFFGGLKPGCQLCVRRESAVEAVLLKAYQRFGNPWKGRDKRILIT
jgi:hypothetical protein